MPLLFLLHLACSLCGTLDISGTAATDAEGNEYNGRWSEECGTMGTSGVWDWNPGYSEIWFFPSGPGDKDWQAIDIEMILGLPSAILQSGGVVGFDKLYGNAFLNPCIDCPQDGAGLTAGEVEVFDGFEEDPCEFDEGPKLLLAWDLTWGAEGGPLYHHKGKDRIVFSTFTTEACSELY